MIEIKSKSDKINQALQKECRAALDQLIQRSDIGFHKLFDNAKAWDGYQALGRELSQKWDNLVVIGLGGSSLSSRLLSEMYAEPNSKKQLYVLDNVDPVEFERLFQKIEDLKKTGWILISKSGSTIETLVSADFVFQKYKAKNLNWLEHVFTMTDNIDNPLKTWSEKNKIQWVEIPANVGGRYSFMTAVGLVPAAFLGLNINEIQKGALRALSKLDSIAEMMSYLLQSFERQEWITMQWFYSAQLRWFAVWWQQLWAESLGKKVDLKGKPAPRVSSPLFAIGASDQHSVLQQVMEGAPDKFIIFNRVLSLEKSSTLTGSIFPTQDFFIGKSMGQLLGAEALGTMQAMDEVGISTLMLELTDLSPQTLGELIVFWELVVAGIGQKTGINAFDQPGVELGKRLAKEILKK